MSPILSTRQQEFIDEENDPFYSKTAIIVKWSIFGALVLFVFVWFVGGYMHARRRIKKGLPVLRYHRFLVPHDQRPVIKRGPQNDFIFSRVDEGYAMNAMPPPVYDPNAPVPPTYQQESMSKVDPNQSYDVPPAGSPSPEVELPPPQDKPTKWTSRINPFKRN